MGPGARFVGELHKRGGSRNKNVGPAYGAADAGAARGGEEKKKGEEKRGEEF